MVTIRLTDLEINDQLDELAMAKIRGGNGMWIWGWIRAYGQRSGGGTTVLNNPVFNIQYANQTINNAGDGPVTALNAPVSSPSTVLNENLSFTSVDSNALNLLGTNIN